MKTIVCEECGQIMGANSESCPNCGAPVGKSSDYNDYGFPSTSQRETTVYESYEDPYQLSDNKSSKNAIIVFSVFAAILALLAVGFYFFLVKDSHKTDDIDNINFVGDSLTSANLDTASILPPDAEIFAAPMVKPEANGFFGVEKCPTSHVGLTVELMSADDLVTSVEIKKNGGLFQEVAVAHENIRINVEEVESPRFLDANFDGFVDIFIGGSLGSSHSVILLWEPLQKKFIFAMENDDKCSRNFSKELFGYYEFNPKKKIVHNSVYFAEIDYDKWMVWNGNKMCTTEIENRTEGQSDDDYDDVEVETVDQSAADQEVYNQSNYKFFNPASVIDYLSHRRFVNAEAGLVVTFDSQGFYVNNNFGGYAPVVRSFTENTATITVNLVPSGSLTLFVYPQRNMIMDTDGNYYQTK